MTIRFDDRVAIVTGAGTGLGRAHAKGLAARGAKVVVNDFHVPSEDNNGRPSAAQSVVAEIIEAGGEAIANHANVADPEQVNEMVGAATQEWGRVDILVNNAGILRDKSFAKMSYDEFRAVLDVHVMGAFNCSKAVWDMMRAQEYGRIVMTASSSGLYGNFGQSNYGTAKMGLVGLMNVLNIEGAKYGIHTNTLAPTAATGMTEGVMPKEMLDLMSVESVTAGLLYLVHNDAPSRLILCAGAGGYAATRIYETDGIYLPPEQQTPEQVAAHNDEILNPENQQMLDQAILQTKKFVEKAAAATGVTLNI